MAWSILYNGNETETMKIPRTRHIRFVSVIFHFDIIWRQNTVDRRTRRRRRVIGIFDIAAGLVSSVRCVFQVSMKNKCNFSTRLMTLRTIIIENIITIVRHIISVAGPEQDYYAPIRRLWLVGDLRSESIELLTTRLIETAEFGVLLLLGRGLQNGSVFFR